MGFFDAYIEEMVQGLSTHLTAHKVNTARAFGPGRQGYPLQIPLVCVGYRNIGREISGSGYLGSTADGEIYLQQVRLEIGLDIYVPIPQGGGKCYEIFAWLGDYFILSGDSRRTGHLTAGQAEYDESLEAWHMEATLHVDAAASYSQETGEVFDDFVVFRTGRENK